METQSPEKDLLGLLENNLKLREQLASLEKDSRVWNRKREMDDLESITALIRKLETDISRTLGDFNALHGGTDDRTSREDFHHAFRIMNDLFQDLKTVKEELEQAAIHPDKLERLNVDWAKLEKTFEEMERHVDSTQEETEISFF